MVSCAASNHEKYLITTWDFYAIKTSRVIRTLSKNLRTEEPCLTVWTWWRNTCQGKVRLSSAQPWSRWRVELSGRLSTCHLWFFLKKFQQVARSRHSQLLSPSFGKFSGWLVAKQFSYKEPHMPSVGCQQGDRTRWVFNPTILKKEKALFLQRLYSEYLPFKGGTFMSSSRH